jgi:hypothetical protein
MPSLIAVLGLNGSAFKANLDKAKHEAREAGHEIASSLGEKVSEKLLEFGSFAAIEEMGRHVLETGEKIYDFSRRLGISTDAVQAWDYALKLNGTTIFENAGFFEKLAVARKKALAGTEESIASFRKLGVTLEDLKSKRLEDVALQIAEAFQAGDPQKLIADLRDVGGRGAGELVAAFRAGLPELVREADKAGVIINEQVINQLKEGADNLKVVWMQFVTGIAPAVAWLGNLVKNLWHDLNVLVNGAVGFATGGFKGARELMHEFDEQSKQRDREEEARRKKSGAGGLVGGGDEVESKKEHREAERAAEKILRLREELTRLQEAGALKEMTAGQKLEELARRRARIEEALQQSQTEEGRLNAQIDIAKIDEQASTAMDQFEREGKKGRAGTTSVNHLQSIGAYGTTPLEQFHQAELKVHESNNKHLAGILTHVQKLADSAGRGARF